MKRIIFVVFCLLSATSCFADNLDFKLKQIESEWEQVDASNNKAQQLKAFPRLLEQATALANDYPAKAEPIILQASIILTQARIQGPFAALKSVHRAKDLLQKSLAIDPKASNGSANVTMGVLYYKVPGWPIAFGDEEKAQQMLIKALEINPQGIDSNFFYGEYLLTQDKQEEAIKYLRRAANATVPSSNTLIAMNLQIKARLVLHEIEPLLLSSKTDSSIPTL